MHARPFLGSLQQNNTFSLVKQSHHIENPGQEGRMLFTLRCHPTVTSSNLPKYVCKAVLLAPFLGVQLQRRRGTFAPGRGVQHTTPPFLPPCKTSGNTEHVSTRQEPCQFRSGRATKNRQDEGKRQQKARSRQKSR